MVHIIMTKKPKRNEASMRDNTREETRERERAGITERQRRKAADAHAQRLAENMQVVVLLLIGSRVRMMRRCSRGERALALA